MEKYMKKILILTVTAGNGHNSCAKSMKRALESKQEDVEVKIVDLLKSYSNKSRVWISDSGYNISVSKLLPVYNHFYYACRKKDPAKRYRCSAMAVAKTVVNGLLNELLEYQPDAVFCTHFYCAAALTALKLVYDLPCKTIVTALDYVNSPFWEACIGVDYFNIPNEDFIDEFISEGFKKEQLLTFGLPVDERTLQTTEKMEAREKLNLDKDTFTIMVMFGGGHWNGGFKIFEDLIEALEERNEKTQVIMINGRNKVGFDKIEKMTFKDNIKVINVGFTDQIPLYLSASDMILNKCGGPSSTEILNQGLPMLVTEKLPGQEVCNLLYLKEKGVALSFKNKKQLKENLYKIINDENYRQDMSNKALALKTPGMSTLAEFILKQENADYSKLLEQNIELSLVKKNVKKSLKQADKKEKKNKRK